MSREPSFSEVELKTHNLRNAEGEQTVSTRALLKKSRRFIGTRPAPGTKPGAIHADPKAHPTHINLIAYNDKEFIEKANVDNKTIQHYLNSHYMVWVNIVGLGDIERLVEISDIFSIHSLALEDVTHVYQRPKVDDYDNNLFIVARLYQTCPKVKDEQISFFLGANYVISILQTPSTIFTKTITRLNNARSHLRTAKSDFLLYELLDTVIDCYFPALQSYGDVMDKLENDTINSPSPKIISHIHTVKHNLAILKRDIWSMRNAISALNRNEEGFITPKTQIYLRDTYDHTVQLVDIIESIIDRSSSLIDIYLSSSTNKLNEVMKVLTIISTIFMPLGFLASVWGMNFDYNYSHYNMPELHTRYGYPVAIGVMILVACYQVFYFYKRGWIGSLAFKRTKPKPTRTRK